ncbi:Rid family hydrolase [Acetobacteraceae bacterium KSS8]|uniref:Rid family hydrolase n=1 Tax=Endosaccharibacter trunci TaxID=2812733 RepID=A0ABT1W6G5_9PROT|nr:Rid family hydrolase [Acetobacteraceae bacterium KSS8]
MSCPSSISYPRRRQHVCRVTGATPGRDMVGASVSDQCRQAFANGADLLRAEGLSIEDVTHVVYLVRDSAAFSTCFPVLRDVFGDARPAATLRMVAQLDTPDTGIELELVASRRNLG